MKCSSRVQTVLPPRDSGAALTLVVSGSVSAAVTTLVSDSASPGVSEAWQCTNTRSRAARGAGGAHFGSRRPLHVFSAPAVPLVVERPAPLGLKSFAGRSRFGGGNRSRSPRDRAPRLNRYSHPLTVQDQIELGVSPNERLEGRLGPGRSDRLLRPLGLARFALVDTMRLLYRADAQQPVSSIRSISRGIFTPRPGGQAVTPEHGAPSC